jgi:hypothetical protein
LIGIFLGALAVLIFIISLKGSKEHKQLESDFALLRPLACGAAITEQARIASRYPDLGQFRQIEGEVGMARLVRWDKLDQERWNELAEVIKRGDCHVTATMVESGRVGR